MWGTEETTQRDGKVIDRKFGKGRVICGTSIREVLVKDKVPVDFAFQRH